MPLTVFEIDAAKPGLRPVKQHKESDKDEKEQKGKKTKGKNDKQFPSNREISVEERDPTGNEPD